MTDYFIEVGGFLGDCCIGAAWMGYAKKGVVRQFGAVVKDPVKAKVLDARKNRPDGGTWQTMNGTYVAYTTSPMLLW